jgi:hypothetical protein
MDEVLAISIYVVIDLVYYGTDLGADVGGFAPKTADRRRTSPNEGRRSRGKDDRMRKGVLMVDVPP